MADSAYPKGQTALLCIDPYNDFLAEDGKMWPALSEVATSVGLHANLARIRATAREAGMPIFILPHHRHHATDFEGCLVARCHARRARDQRSDLCPCHSHHGRRDRETRRAGRSMILGHAATTLVTKRAPPEMR